MSPITQTPIPLSDEWATPVEVFAPLHAEFKFTVDAAAAALKAGATLAFWKANADGTPANGGSGTVAQPGLIEEVTGPLELCGRHALHGTFRPDKWNGDKVWIVALYPPIATAEDKMGSLKREILGEAQ